jgi:hypothetical protein
MNPSRNLEPEKSVKFLSVPSKANKVGQLSCQPPWRRLSAPSRVSPVIAIGAQGLELILGLTPGHHYTPTRAHCDDRVSGRAWDHCVMSAEECRVTCIAGRFRMFQKRSTDREPDVVMYPLDRRRLEDR